MTFASFKKRAFVLISSIKEVMMGDLGYYSSAMTYKFLMVLSSLFILLGFLTSFLPFLNPDRMFELISQMLPKYGAVMFKKLKSLHEHRGVGSLLSVALSYFFVVSYAKMFAKSLSFIFGTRIESREVFLWVFIPIYLLFFSLTVLLGSAFLSVVQTFIPKGLSILITFVKSIIFLPLIYAMYWFFLRGVLKPRYILEASIYFLVALNIINFVFYKFLAKLLALNPLYGVLGSLLLSLVFLEITFSFLLGAVWYARGVSEI